MLFRSPAWWSAPNNVITFGLVEASISPTNDHLTGMAFLYGSARIIMQGDVTITLPRKAGNSVDWGLEAAPGGAYDNAINVAVAINGTSAVFEDANNKVFAPAPWVDEFMIPPTSPPDPDRPNGQRAYRIRYSGTEPAKVNVSVFGVRSIGSTP